MKRFEIIEKAIDEFRQGKMLVVVDDEDRENEGDFIVAAEMATPDDINFMMKHGRGLVCMPITQDCANQFNLGPMVPHTNNTALYETNFTISVDAVKNATTGISSADRWETVQVLLDEDAKPSALGRPGHMFPLTAKDGGVLQRAGHTEASVDLAILAELKPAALLVEIVDEDGSMARGDRLKEIAEEHNLTLITIADLIEYRRKKEELVDKLSMIPLPNKYGDFNLILFEDKIHGDHHVALVMGDIKEEEDTLVRVHSQCLTGDIFGSFRCDCGQQLEGALNRIEEEGKGVLIYLRQEGRGIGLKNKIKAYQLQDDGLDTVEANEKLGYDADLREYGIGAQILRKCGVRKMRILTNNPRKIVGIEGYGLEVIGREPLEFEANRVNEKYLKTKRDKLGHFILGEE
jgi:3,4-dihydroxy 2-butanone 4-phosphate synthase / GTP cyclohydrolase II